MVVPPIISDSTKLTTVRVAASRLTRALSDSKMDNPYSSPAETSNGKSLATTRRSKWQLGITAAVVVIMFAGFCFSAFMLIAQALNDPSDAIQVPPQLRNSAATKSSWMLGFSSVVLALATGIAGAFAFQRRLLIAWAMLATCIVIFVIMAIALKPM